MGGTESATAVTRRWLEGATQPKRSPLDLLLRFPFALYDMVSWRSARGPQAAAVAAVLDEHAEEIAAAAPHILKFGEPPPALAALLRARTEYWRAIAKDQR